MYVCKYVCMYVWMYVCMYYAYMLAGTVCMYACMYYAYMHAGMYYACVYVWGKSPGELSGGKCPRAVLFYA